MLEGYNEIFLKLRTCNAQDLNIMIFYEIV